MLKNDPGKMRLKNFHLIAGVCLVFFVVYGAVYLFNNGIGRAHWLKEDIASADGKVSLSAIGDFSDTEIYTFSQVNLFRREYHSENHDLIVKVSGEATKIRRSYDGNKWSFGPLPSWKDMSTPEKPDLQFSKKGEKVAEIELDGEIYSSEDEKTWKNRKLDKIAKTRSGYRWENPWSWREYDESGRMTSYGNRFGTLCKYLYETEPSGRITGITDSNGNQVIWYEYNEDGYCSAVYDKTGRRVEYSYTDEGLLGSVTDVMGYKTSFEYDRMGRLVKTINPLGRESIITYYIDGDIASNLDGDGIGFLFEFDYDEDTDEYYARTEYSYGKVKEVWFDGNGSTKRVDINGRTAKTVEKEGNALIITKNGHVTREEYDEFNNLIRMIYPDDTEVSYEYDNRLNKVTREIDEAGVMTEFEYNEKGVMTKKVEASGTDVERATEYSYDKEGNEISIKSLGDANTAETITTMTYDEYGNKASEIDPEGNTTYFTYDIMGNVLSKTNAKGEVWTYEYDAMGRLISDTDPQGNKEKFFHDGAGHVTKRIDSEGRDTVFEWDRNGRLISMTDALDNVTLFEYNDAGQMVKQTDPEGKEIHYTYDAEDRLVITTDGNGNEFEKEYDGSSECFTCSEVGSDQVSRVIYPTYIKEYTYDARGRKIEELDVLSDTESYLKEYMYDSKGNLIQEIDKEGKTTRYVYDELNRRVKVIDPMNGETSYTYDNRDNLIAVTDAENNTTSFDYDRNNRRVKEIRPMGEETTYQYDAMGNLIKKIDAKNQKYEYQYNNVGKLEEVRFFKANDLVNPVKVVSFTYDSLGKLLSYDDGTTSTWYEYDDGYRKTSETVNYGPFSKTNTYTYYKNGRKRTFTGPDGITYGYSYDGNNQLTGVKIPYEGSVEFNDYIWNRPKTVSFPGGITKEYTYDPLMRIESITSTAPKVRGKSEGVLLNHQYSYDKMSNITIKQTEHGDYTYEYNDLYSLTKVESPILNAESFTYDAVGNRLTTSETTGQLSYNPNNELLTTDNVQYSYDPNGNMVQKTVDGVVTNYIYNVENRLSEVRDDSGSLIASYYYDPFGRRLWKEVDGIRTYFHHEDGRLIGEYNSSGVEIKTYGYKPSIRRSTDPLFMKEGGTYYFYHNDHMGTPQKITSVDGVAVWEAKYSSFGEAIVEVETVENNLRFPGQYYDQETGLHYNYFRYYDPKIGRYLRYDPIGIIPNEKLYTSDTFSTIPPDINHVYSYAKNNSITFIDPFGLTACPTINTRVAITIPDDTTGQTYSGWQYWYCYTLTYDDCTGFSLTCKYYCYYAIDYQGSDGTWHYSDWITYGYYYYTMSCC